MQLSLFEVQNYTRKPNIKKGDLVILSASRRTDMPRWFKNELIKQLDKYPPEVVHSIVLWTKFPKSLLTKELKECLSKYQQLFINLTITGLGGTEIEPNVPDYKQSLFYLQELIDFVGNPKRIRLRIDPIVDISIGKKNITNKEIVYEIVDYASKLGITEFVTSFLVPYGKVKQRMNIHGFVHNEWKFSDKKEYFNKLREYVNSLGCELYACSVEGLPKTACIDGDLLRQLHPYKSPCSTYQPHTRDDCNCSHSIDLGYYDMKCKSNCVYCYANTEE